MSPTVIAGSLWRGSKGFVLSVLGIQLLVALVVAVSNGALRSPDPVVQSVWEMPGVVWIRYPLIGAGAALASSTLVPFLASGITRHQYLKGAALFGAWICVFVAGIGIAAYGAERLVYAAGGWETDIVNQAVVVMFAMYVVLLAAYVITGVLFAAAYMRFSGWTATGLVLPFLVPMAATEVLLGTWWVGIADGQDKPDRLPLTIGMPLAVLVLALATWIVFVLLRDVAVKPKKG